MIDNMLLGGEILNSDQVYGGGANDVKWDISAKLKVGVLKGKNGFSRSVHIYSSASQ